MKKQCTTLTSILVLATLLLASACGSAPANPTVTVTEKGCSYAGPAQLTPQFKLTTDLKVTTPPLEYGVGFVFLTEGATEADLKAVTNWNASNIPSGIRYSRGAGVVAPGVSSSDIDLTTHGLYTGQPVYLLCVDPASNTIGVIGPIAVKM